MRPLPMPKKTCKPLLQRMAEDKAMQMERDSLMGSSHFMVQLPDGSYEKRVKVPVNVDPGVHSTLNLDEVMLFYFIFHNTQHKVVYYRYLLQMQFRLQLQHYCCSKIKLM